jgi:hypothetical protein
MATKQDKKYTPKLREILGTQEEATALNNGGATQIVLNKREKKSECTKEIKNEDTKPEE